jgi:hypothetical protein
MSRDHFTHMANDEFKTRESIKDAIYTQTEGMSLNINTELQSSHTERNTVVIEFLLEVRRGDARMHVDNRVEFLNGGPENVILGLIVHEHLFTIGAG